MAAKIELKVRYHYWDYSASSHCGCGCGYSSEPELYRNRYERIELDGKEMTSLRYEKVGENPFTKKVLEFLENNFHFKNNGGRTIVIAEDMDTAEFGYAIIHPKDEENRVFNKKLGRTIALGRLKKRLGMKTK